MPPATGTTGTRTVPVRPSAAAGWPLRPGVIITVAALLGLGLRLFQLTRPGYLTGFTQYDDGVYIGNALRLVDGVIPYRDFAMVQPPGSMLLMVPAALVGKAFGSMSALAAARILTVGAETANVVLVGLLVRHRGPLAVAVASGGYAVYPAALNASQSLFLEPWLNLFCLLGAVLLFDGDQITGLGDSDGRKRRTHGALWAGVCFGFATAVKIWAVVPALVAWVLCLTAGRGRRPRPAPPRPALSFAAGFAAGFVVPCLPFEILAPGGFGRTVFVSELVQATHGRVGASPRVADITGIIRLSSVGANPRIWQGVAAAVVLFLFVVAAWVRARRVGLPITALDWFALVTTIAVIVMLFSPSEWYVHYAAFAGSFLVVLLGLSAAWLFTPAETRSDKPREARHRIQVVAAAAAFTALAIAAIGAADGYTATTLYPARSLQGASALIAPGACVLTDTASATIAIDRFSARSPGCPAVVDSVGTLIATTHGQDFAVGPGVLQADTQVWQQAFEHADYVWLIGRNGYTGARIAWTPALRAYFADHFTLIAMRSSLRGAGNVPRGGLYIRKSLATGAEP